MDVGIRTMLVYDTKTVINVSQNALSSSSPVTSNSRQVEEVLQVVEDSYPAEKLASKGSASDLLQERGEEDELYDLSPQGRASLDALRSTGAPSSLRPRSDAKLTDNSTAVTSANFTGNRRESHQVTDNFPTALPSSLPRKASHKQPLASDKLSNQAAPAAHSNEMPGNSSTIAARPAMAALLARRDARTAAPRTATNDRSQSQASLLSNKEATTTKSAMQRLPLTERDKNFQRSAVKSPNQQAVDLRFAAEKLVSPRKHVRTQNSNQTPARMQTGWHDRKVNQQGGDHSAPNDTKQSRRPKSSESHTRPSVPSKKLQSSDYDIPESASSAEPSPPRKKSRKTKSAASRTAGRSTRRPAKGDEIVAARPRTRAASKMKSVEPMQGAKQTTATNPDRLTTVSGGASSDLRDSKTMLPGRRGKSGVKHADRQETVEDLEEAFVNYGADEENLGELSKGKHDGRKTAAEQEISTGRPVKKEILLRKSIEQQLHGRGPRGSSQKEPIILSDHQTSSSAVPSPRSKTALKAIPQSQGRRHDTPTNRPQTPAAFRSSPPGVWKSGATMHIDPVAVDTGRKSTIIGFGRSGPRNQGSISGRKTIAVSGYSASLDPRRRNGPSSLAAGSIRTTISQRVAPPPNLAPSVNDALDGFFKNSNRAESTSKKTEIMRGHGPHATHDAYKANPVHVVDDSLVAEDDFDGPTLVNDLYDNQSHSQEKVAKEPTALQIAMPPPAPKTEKKKKLHRAPTVPMMVSSKRDEDTTTVNAEVSAKFELKRKAFADQENVRPAKILKTTTISQGLQARAAPPERDVLPDNELPKLAVGQVVDQAQQDISAGPSKYTARRLSRRVSQGSQTVDIGGSPVPKGMIVPEMATALDTFLQGTGLSSEQALGDVMTRKDRIATRLLNCSLANRSAPPPSHQPEPSSSDSDLHSASLATDLQAEKEVHLSKIDATHVPKRDDGLVAGDAFATSEEASKRPTKESTSSTFFERFRRDVRKPEQGLRAQDERPTRPVVHPRQDRAKKEISPLSSDSSSYTSSESEAAARYLQKLGSWREALHPHQMNLFDELVNISHRLVSHLVSQEEASRNVVDDYRRRGLRLVEEMEHSHAHQYKQALHDLKREKKQVRKELSKRSKQLRDFKDTVERLREDKKVVGDEGAVQKMRQLMAEYC